MADYRPKNPSGYVPGAEFIDIGDPSGIKVGVITRVDEFELKCDIKILTGGGERFELDLTQGMAGPRSFWGGIPEVNSMVILGFRRRSKQLQEAMILGYLPVGKRSGLRFDPLASSDPSTINPEDVDLYHKLFTAQTRYKRLQLKPGDVGGMSASGSEFALTKDVRFVNRAGDSFELRDADRTLVSQSLCRVENEAGILRTSGPARRSGFYLPPDIFSDGKTLKTSEDSYFGNTVLKRFTVSENTVIDSINDTTNFSSVTYSNGRQVYYPTTFPGVNIEDPDIKQRAGAEVYTEDRLELTHTTDLTQEVREEIDGFQMDRRPVFIERVLGTLVGNDTSSTTGLQQYGQILRPKIFDDFLATGATNFATEAIARSPLDDIESYTTAGAYLLRIIPPPNPAGRSDTTSVFAVAVSKQGKLFVNIPGSRVEKYSSGTKNVSAEINMEGALKMRLGAAKPDNIALHLTLEGGAVFDFRGSSSGAGLTFRTHSSYVIEAQGVQDNNNIAYSENLQGNRQAYSSGDSIERVDGAKVTTVNGRQSILADRFSVNAHSGYSLNAGESNVLVSGKSQYNYAQQVLETIVTGGKITTVLAGGITEIVAVGAHSTSVLGGAMSINVPAGAYTVTVGSGAISISTAAGAMSLSAAAGAISITAGLAMSLTAGAAMVLTSPVAITLTSPQVLVGNPGASMGVCRGLPSLPPGSMTLDPIIGTPLFGAALFRSAI
jgi:hypothetical protein